MVGARSASKSKLRALNGSLQSVAHVWSFDYGRWMYNLTVPTSPRTMCSPARSRSSFTIAQPIFIEFLQLVEVPASLIRDLIPRTIL